MEAPGHVPSVPSPKSGTDGMETWPAKTEQDKELGVAKMHTHSLDYFRQLQYDTLVDVIARKLHNIIDDPCHNYVNIELSM